MNVRIYQLDRGVSLWRWLCPEHLAERQREGWHVTASKPAPHPLNCDLCPREDEE
jgi:hypothetical protein